MSAPTRRTPGVQSPGLADDLAGGDGINVDSTPGHRQRVGTARLVIELAQVLPLIEGHVDPARFAEVEARIVHVVAEMVSGGKS